MNFILSLRKEAVDIGGRRERMDRFCASVISEITHKPLREGFGKGGFLDVFMDYWMHAGAVKRLHRLIIHPKGRLQIAGLNRELKQTEALALHVTNSSNTEKAWFCISVHRWVLRNTSSGVSDDRDGYIDPAYWEDQQKLPGEVSSFYVLHIPWPKAN